MKMLLLLFFFFYAESLSDAGDLTTQNRRPAQDKEEEEETKEQPAAKRKRGQSKSQTETEVMPKEEIKSEGNVGLILICTVFVTPLEIGFYRCSGIGDLQNEVIVTTRSNYFFLLKVMVFAVLHIRCLVSLLTFCL